MATREEIREGIDRTLWQLEAGEITIFEAKQQLHSQGVVIKVEGELPEPMGVEILVGTIIHDTQQAMVKAGYTLTESLVEE